MRVNKTAAILWALSSLGASAANADVSVVEVFSLSHRQHSFNFFFLQKPRQ